MDSTPAKTIDNLGKQAYEQFDTTYTRVKEGSLIQESATVAPKTEVSFTESVLFGNWDRLFDATQKNAPWAIFNPPRHYHTKRYRLYKRGLAPSFNDEEYIEFLFRRLSEEHWGENPEEKQSLIEMLQKIEEQLTLMQSIYGERYRYAKG